MARQAETHAHLFLHPRSFPPSLLPHSVPMHPLPIPCGYSIIESYMVEGPGVLDSLSFYTIV